MSLVATSADSVPSLRERSGLALGLPIGYMYMYIRIRSPHLLIFFLQYLTMIQIIYLKKQKQTKMSFSIWELFFSFMNYRQLIFFTEFLFQNCLKFEFNIRRPVNVLKYFQTFSMFWKIT